MNMQSQLKVVTAANATPLQASKWLSFQVLLDEQEMAHLLTSLGGFEIWRTGVICPLGEGLVPKEEFLKAYGRYIDALKEGHLPSEAICRDFFSTVFSTTRDALYVVDTGNGQGIVRPEKPVIQLQNHRLDYSHEDGKFRPRILGGDSIFWGIQFSYPQIFQDNKTYELMQVSDTEFFPNTKLFKALQVWVRQNTIPTPFIVDDKQINVPMRLGKQCHWINQHPQLASKGIGVKL